LKSSTDAAFDAGAVLAVAACTHQRSPISRHGHREEVCADDARRLVMYVLVQHSISDPARFFALAEEANKKMPSNLTLHHTFNAEDGTKGVCVWEADSVATVKDFLEAAVGAVSRNDYYEVPNKEGIVFPKKIKVTA
jgi:hypothetical protein